MSSEEDNKKSNALVVVTAVDEEETSIGPSRVEEGVPIRKRQPWWSYIWVSLSILITEFNDLITLN